MNILADISALFTSAGAGVLLIGAAVGVSLVLLTWGLSAASELLTSPLRRRLDDLHTENEGSNSLSRRIGRWIDRLRPLLEPKEQVKRQGLKERLERAGLRSERALVLLYTAKVLMIVLAPITMVVVAVTYSEKVSSAMLFLLALGSAAAGWLLPNMYIEKRFQNRRRTMLESLPDALDLLVSCTEAGMGLNAALERVAEQMPSSSSDLAEELQLVNVEIRAGIDRSVALRNLAERTGLDELRGLVALINHSMRFGTGIAETLRIYSEEFRDRRMQRAEELGAMVGTKLIFPLIFCIFPSFFLVAIGPAIIGVARAISASNFGGH